MTSRVVSADENNSLAQIQGKNVVPTHANAKLLAASTRNKPLSDITNTKDQADIKGKKNGVAKKPSSKRPLAAVGGEVEVVEQKTKKRKSDTDLMIVDTEVVNSPIEDIDACDADDPQAVVQYVDDIYAFMMEKEKLDQISPKYMSKQSDVNEKMRAILVDWLVEVHRMFKLLPETLFLTVNLIDKYLHLKNITRDKLQLVGITCMLIASKYEEIYAPECNDFVYISDGAYTKEQILTMEKSVLNSLNFNLTTPSPLHFLRRFSKAAGSDYTIHTLCKYLIELALIDVKLLKYTPSKIAAASVYVARRMTEKAPVWNATLQHYTTYAESEVLPAAVDLNELLKKAQKSSLKGIVKKYSLPKYGSVATIALVEVTDKLVGAAK